MNGHAARTIKRLFDFVVALLLLVVASPILFFAILSILLETGVPVFFRQERAGLRGRPFRIFKLRTMRVDVPRPEVVGQVTSGNQLVTHTGALLRRLKVDELVQLLNVLRGEMSLVGPRPTLISQVAEYGPVERERLEVLPGLTGWAQVNGNILLSWTERIVLDRWYVRRWSLWLDVRILWRTVDVVLHGERVNAAALTRAREDGL